MPKNKTEYTSEDVMAFVETVAEEQKKKDCYYLIDLMRKHSGEAPKMFGPSIVGFGKYHYKYASGHEGEAPLIGFSPRKAAISLYVFTGLSEHEHLLKDLGKFKMGKACIYAKKMEDINEAALVKLMETSIQFLSERYERMDVD